MVAAGSAGPANRNGLFVGPMDDTDRFELVGLGLVGGEGVTWCGRYTGRLHHPVTYAIKQIQPPPPRSSSVWPTRSDMRRWLDQRFLLQTVTNDHLVRLVDVFLGPPPHRRGDVQLVPDGVEFATPYLVMEWVAGLTVAERVERRLDPIGVRVQWVLHIAEALDALHSYTRTSGNPMLHCDVKPDNCIVHPERGAVLVDVGALRGLDDGVDSRGLHTERYAAPEVLADATAPRSTASDLYGLGALAYFCLVQDDPPAATRAGAVDQMRAALTAAAAAAGVGDAAAVTEAVLAMLAPDPAARPTHPKAWARSLVAATTGPPRDASESGRRRAGPAWQATTAGTGLPARRTGRYAAALVTLAAASAVAATQLPISRFGPATQSAGQVGATPVGTSAPAPPGPAAALSPSATSPARAPTSTPSGVISAVLPTASAGSAAPLSRTPRTTAPSPLVRETPAPAGTRAGSAVPATAPRATLQIQSLFASRCIDVRGPSPDDGTPLQLWDCINTPEERWSWDGSRLRGFADKCIDVRGPSSANGTPVQLYSCVEEPQQQWTLTLDGELRVFGDKCLDVQGPVNANGTSLQIWDCQDLPQQKWRFY